MIRRPPRSTLSSSSAASDVYKRQEYGGPRTEPMQAQKRKRATVEGPAGQDAFSETTTEVARDWRGSVPCRGFRSSAGCKWGDKCSFAHGEPRVFTHGNYDRYYGYRNQWPGGEDARLRLLRAEWFRGRKCLDIGCNVGKLTMGVDHKFECSSMLGVDIDPGLIEQAKVKNNQHGVQSRVEFACLDFVSDSSSLSGNKYDVIMCMSVTKWMHLNPNPQPNLNPNPHPN
eukprot:TRINITY_DN7959_c0_g1_i8.p1 TRINITY_DN7959_c0_g1~~TRINITY_DN7959_c0_g1_i8.p1  ORF type:complete len:228 (+),score=38.84 TRINITY_DN7959_c0_g1_i8:93-776(+)